MSSAILYSFYRSLRPPVKGSTQWCTPIMNIPEEDLRLRPEFTELFKHCDTWIESLATLNNLPSTLLIEPEATKWILVDHNKLEGELGKVYGHRVKGCIDHHEDENAIPGDGSTDPHIIDKCGSCTSLVVHHLFQSLWENGPGPDGDISGFLKIALASILVDTTNLKNKDKTRPVDISAVEFLESKLKPLDESWDRDAFFKDISDAKNDIERLPLKGILRKDYKQWTEEGMKLGTSSVVKPLSFLVEKCREEAGISVQESYAWATMSESFMKAQEMAVWAILTTYSTEDGDFRRELMVQWVNEVAGEAVELFEKECTEVLKLEKININDVKHGEFAEPEWRVGRRAWQQGNVAASRKQVAPLFRAAMKGTKSGPKKIQKIVEEMKNA